jgi:hypothetical protein
MNYSTTVFLINKNVRAVIGVYEPEDGKKKTIFKTLDQSIEVDDLAIVPSTTRHGMTVVKIIEVDADIDFDSTEQINWIVSKVDKAEYEQTIKREQSAIQAIKSAEMRKKRDDLRAALFKDQEALKNLSLSNLSDSDEPAPVQPPNINDIIF